MDSTNIFRWSTETDSRFWNEYYMQLLSHTKFIRPFVSEVTKRMLDDGHKIIFITSRMDNDLPTVELESMFQITKKYLIDNYICYTELILSENKQEIILQKNIDVMIEDNPVFFKKYNQLLNIPLLCFDTPYNTRIIGKNIIRVYSWYDILQKIYIIERKTNEYTKK